METKHGATFLIDLAEVCLAMNSHQVGDPCAKSAAAASREECGSWGSGQG